jgi:hypothetical protein
MNHRIAIIVGLLGLFCARTQLQSDVRTISYWNGWYEKGHKIGYMQSIVQSYGDHYRFERRGKLTTGMMGGVATVTPISVCNTDRNFALKDFDFTTTTPGHEFHVIGVVRGRKILMSVESGGQKQSSSLDIEGPVYPLDALPLLIRSKNLQPKQKYEITVFDPMVQRTNNAEIAVLGPDKLVLRDTARAALKVASVIFGVPHATWIDSSGIVLQEEAPPSSLMILEPSSVAMATRADETPPDLMRMFAIPSNMQLDNARQLKYVKLELGGIDPVKFNLNDESQKIINVTPVTLTIAPAGPPVRSPQLPLSGETTATKATPTVQSDNPMIVRKARELAGGSSDAVQVARAINDWVFRNVRQAATPSMPSATDVLQTMEGDCNEHAALYAGLCRAAGIPTKICAGVVYRDGYFWYHAWNKVYVGNWVPVDPTFGQFPVDATHIRLTEGEMDQQAQVLNVVGNLTVKILETKP